MITGDDVSVNESTAACSVFTNLLDVVNVWIRAIAQTPLQFYTIPAHVPNFSTCGPALVVSPSAQD